MRQLGYRDPVLGGLHHDYRAAAIRRRTGEGARTTIDAEHRVFGYPDLYVIDDRPLSANPGVNPSLTITALAERAMSRIRALRATEKPA